MSKKKTPARKQEQPPLAYASVPVAAEASEPLLSARLLTRAAFVLALALVLVRGTMLEILRDPLDIKPGTPPIPRDPGASTSLVLDLLAWVPALLVLGRAAIDRSFRLVVNASHVIAGALALLALLSTGWASDKFAAAVTAFHFVSAIVFLWAATQLVRDWRRLRIVAGACAALLCIHGVEALNSRYVEQPEMRRDWEQRREQHLRDHGLEPGSFAAQQFEAKLLRGEMMGFDASPNTFAAVTVLLLVVTAGLVIQRLADRDGVGWIVLPLVGMALAAAIIVWVDSKTAFVTPLIAAGILAMLAVARGLMTRWRRVLFVAGVVGFVAFSLLIVLHGHHRGTLFIDSLTFRWHYWVGAARVFAAHPLLGVGWENFGLHYLAVRLPIAAEEVRDPHNLFVRFFTELGIVGGLLAAAWMLRLWWELTQRPAVTASSSVPATSNSPVPRPAFTTAAVIAIAAFVLGVLAYVDLGFLSRGGDAGPSFVILQILTRVVGVSIVFVMLWVATARSLAEPATDDRPAPWVLYGVIAGLGVFLLHNLVDFAMFEVGPMFLFALLVGSALGMRAATTVGDTSSTAATKSMSRTPRVAVLATAGVLWLIGAVVLVIPVLSAEESAAEGDEYLRTAAFARAVRAFEDAAATVPYNGDYHIRAAGLLQASDIARARNTIDDAIRTNPFNAAYRFNRAAFEASLEPPDPAKVRSAYDEALALDPMNIPSRLEYAEQLERLGFPADARAQYEDAQRRNDQLAPDEVERIPPARLAEVQAAVSRLSRSATQPAAGT